MDDVCRPLKIKVDLRDKWEKADAPAKLAIKDLEGVLGLTIQVNMQPAQLWQELEKFHVDQGTFVPAVVEVIQGWADALRKRLEDEADADWADELLEKFGKSSVPVYVEVCSISRLLYLSVSFRFSRRHEREEREVLTYTSSS